MTNDLAARVEALLCQMTLEEKAAQMMQIPYTMVGREESLRWAKLGAGSFLHVLGDEAREVQQAAMSSRLGIPVIFGIDAIHGHGLNDHATIFPSQLAAACSWDPAIAREMGRVTAREVATDGLHWTFSPVLCLGRDTRWGRVDETFGEDPYLAGELGAAIIEGYQGESLDSDESILACAKHYIGYGEALGGRDACDTEMTYRKLREVFLPPFKRAVEAGCATVMTAYGSIDGTPFTIDPKSMKDILRGELGFDGFVVTDWDNCHHLIVDQHIAADIGEASVLAAKGGNDMMMTSLGFYEAAIKAVRDGRLEESVLDEAVRHILTVKLRMNLFEKPEKKGVPGCIGCEEHLASALDAARRSVTLLRNDGMLPLKAGVKKIAVIGPNADNIQNQYGDWTYFTHPVPHTGHPPVRPYVTVKEGFEKLCAEKGIELAYHQGCGVKAAESDNIPGAVAAARDADAIILVLGDEQSQIGEGQDRANLDLSGRQMELFHALRALGIPLATVLVASKPLCLGDAATKANAVVCAFNGGMFGGQAVAEAAFGCFNPSGRLPISFPHHAGQVPVYYNQLPGWHGWPKGHYCDLPAEPLFTFGEGLSYTTFAYDSLTFDAGTLTAEVAVTNTGKQAGTETVQVYFRDMASSVLTPVKRLIAFKRITLQPGETAAVRFQLTREDFSLINRDEQRVTEPGAFTLFIGHSAKDDDLLSAAFTL
ncbi:MAG: glycoside hydrolase family 3 C-terminal domain-containing protein [Christensenellaceae bacterium]|nr:glycoside hydrolase family 3 C-terminal domain-containing protein [Christensenellaceae bacterium]